CFFFSSRRRHTRWPRDWSSDVCSSDLIVYPEISEMQARAVFEAAAEVQRKGTKVHPEIMIPLVGFPRELKLQIDIVHRVADDVRSEERRVGKEGRSRGGT